MVNSIEKYGIMSVKKKYYIIFAVSLFLLVGCLSILYALRHATGDKLQIKKRTINTMYYISGVPGGLLGNHEAIRLSTKDSLFDPNKDYIFYTDKVYYKLLDDSVIVVVAIESSILLPPGASSCVIIKGLKSFDDIDYYNKNFRSLGFEVFNLY